jgi:hypothetical protein
MPRRRKGLKKPDWKAEADKMREQLKKRKRGSRGGKKGSNGKK